MQEQKSRAIWLNTENARCHEHCSKTVWDRFILAYTPGVLRVFCSGGFPYVIAPAFSTPAFSTPAFSAPPPSFVPGCFFVRVLTAKNNNKKKMMTMKRPAPSLIGPIKHYTVLSLVIYTVLILYIYIFIHHKNGSTLERRRRTDRKSFRKKPTSEQNTHLTNSHA